MIAIAKSEAKARERRKQLEEKKALFGEAAAGASETLKEIDEAVASVDATAKTIADETSPSKGSHELRAAIEKAEAEADKLKGLLAEGSKKLESAQSVCGEDEEMKSFARAEVTRMQTRLSMAKERLQKVDAAVKKAKDVAVRISHAEIEELRTKVCTGITALAKDGKTREAIFDDVNGGNAVTRAKFAEFVAGIADLIDSPLTTEAGRLFDSLVVDGESLSQEVFLRSFRSFYKVVKATVLSETVSIKSKTVRRLDAGEPLEVLEGPMTDEGVDVQRVKCRAPKDAAEGWVTLSGNQGTVFLEPGGNLYACMKETSMTDELSVASAKIIR